MVDVAVLMLVFSALLVVIAALQPVADRMKVPASVLLAAVGVAVGAGSSALLLTPLTDTFDMLVRPIVDLPIKSSTFIYVFLPLLLFQTALTIDVRRMMEDAAPILLMAVVAVIVATAVIGASLNWLFSVPIVVALLLGSIVATTDPAPVTAIFREIGAPARLTRLVEGESLLNDAAAIALFSLLYAILTAGADLDLGSASARFVVTFVGGAALGLAGGKLLVMALPWLGGLRAAEATLTLAAPYLVFILGDQIIGVSGVVAVVVLGLVLSGSGRSCLSPKNFRHLKNVWDQIGYWVGSLLFILAGLLMPRLLADLTVTEVLIVLTVVAAAIIARALVLYLLLPALSAFRLGQQISPAYKVTILWGGLRGAVTVALAMAVTESPLLPDDIKRFVGVAATGFVLFTLFVNGTSLRWFIRKLGLDKLSPMDQLLRDQVLALALADVRDSVKEVGSRYELAPTAVRPVANRYDERVSAMSAAAENSDGMADLDRLVVALIALANRERELVLEHHGQGSASQPVVEVLLRHAEKLIEGARTSGRSGYSSAARKLVRFPRSFRLAHELHRRLRIDTWLTRKVTERFEVLLIERLILQELKSFVGIRLKPLFGLRMAEVLADIITTRLGQTTTALEALRLQYPDYAEALERRFLRQFALRQEVGHYDALRKEGLLNNELYNILRRGVMAHERWTEERPRLDLRLNTRDLAHQLPMLEGLSDHQVEQISKLFRPCFAVPGEFIIRRGDRGSAVYFISTGAVEVRLPTSQTIRLGRGDFFGEMALLGRRRRMADVVALTYCHLLVLNATEFKEFLNSNPLVRRHVENIVRKRREMTRPMSEDRSR